MTTLGDNVTSHYIIRSNQLGTVIEEEEQEEEGGGGGGGGGREVEKEKED